MMTLGTTYRKGKPVLAELSASDPISWLIVLGIIALVCAIAYFVRHF
jgi:hypothetical protein